MNTKMIDLDVDYIDSRSITQKELDEIAEFIRKDKLQNAQAETSVKRTLPIFRRTTQRKKELA